ncbi:hypothetical protein [Klebsiella electrica]|uniref:Uncharacterized protein n=1 Tax=Klebsiella electrica TaxID=1259973 RepID=A0AAJ5QWB5_9ENTR|nr:hypothetical protein [Klebsiella electrica]WBW63297.1 hypothetical protein OR613_10560 [Klebsiella electrica]
MQNDITELALIAKIKKQLENFDTLVLKEDEANALVEALEKAQSRDVIQSAKDYHFDQQADRIAELDAELEREREKSRRVMSRIAELESRTVTVKLPQAVSTGGQGYQEQVERILTAAGIKWEAE